MRAVCNTSESELTLTEGTISPEPFVAPVTDWLNMVIVEHADKMASTKNVITYNNNNY